MMHQPIGNKLKYLIFLFLFISLTTFNNLELKNLNIFKIKEIEIIEVNISPNTKIKKNLEHELIKFKNKNIFLVDKINIKSQILKNEWVSEFSVQKKYPSKLIINFDKANPLANMIINDQSFLIGSNFRLIKSDVLYKDLPNVFGEPNMNDLKKFVKKVELSKINYKLVTDIYYLKSGRWNIKIENKILIKLPDTEIIHSLNLVNRILNNKDIVINNTINLTPKNQIIIN